MATKETGPSGVALKPQTTGWKATGGNTTQKTLTIDEDLTASTVNDGLVTNGDSHDHSGGDGAQISHAGLGSLQGGTAGEYYHLTAAEYAALGGGSVGTTVEHLTGSGNWTVPDDIYMIWVTLSAAGGSGGGGADYSGVTGKGGGGGGAAAVITEVPIAVKPGDNISYSVPAAAIGGLKCSDGADGGDCSFGSIKCLGGKKGAGAPAGSGPGNGGVGGAGTYNAIAGGAIGAKPTATASKQQGDYGVPGSGGGTGGSISAGNGLDGAAGAASLLYGATNASPTGLGGLGGSNAGGGGGGGADSLFGGGGRGGNGVANNDGNAGNNGTGYGSGGGGGAGAGNTAGKLGGPGGDSGPGIIILRY